MRKAFDTVSYETLINELQQHDIRGVARNLLNFYPTGRMQYVQTEGVTVSQTNCRLAMVYRKGQC